MCRYIRCTEKIVSAIEKMLEVLPKCIMHNYAFNFFCISGTSDFRVNPQEYFMPLYNMFTN